MSFQNIAFLQVCSGFPAGTSGTESSCQCGRGFPAGTSGTESSCQCGRHERLGFDPWGGKISWSRKWQSAPACLPGEFHTQRSLAGYSLWGRKELDTTGWLIILPHTQVLLVEKIILFISNTSLLSGAQNPEKFNSCLIRCHMTYYVFFKNK